jgi:hypothetical protein
MTVHGYKTISRSPSTRTAAASGRLRYRDRAGWRDRRTVTGWPLVRRRRPAPSAGNLMHSRPFSTAPVASPWGTSPSPPAGLAPLASSAALRRCRCGSSFPASTAPSRRRPSWRAVAGTRSCSAPPRPHRPTTDVPDRSLAATGSRDVPPALPGVSRIGLPPASPGRCDGPAAKVSHLHSVQQRLVALEVHQPQPVWSFGGEVRSTRSGARCALLSALVVTKACRAWHRAVF